MSQRAKASFVKIPLEFVGEPDLSFIITFLHYYLINSGKMNNFAEINRIVWLWNIE